MIADKTLNIVSPEFASVALAHIGVDDLNNLRIWKNEKRDFFNFKGIISSQQQSDWFEAYRRRPDDHMFIVKAGSASIGCIGFRVESGAADIYNVILGLPDMGGQGYMSKAMAIMCSFIRTRYGDLRVGLRVLKENPAVRWYKRNGFLEIGEKGDCLLLQRHREATVPAIQYAVRSSLAESDLDVA